MYLPNTPRWLALCVLTGCSLYDPYPAVPSSNGPVAEVSQADSSVSSTANREVFDAGTRRPRRGAAPTAVPRGDAGRLSVADDFDAGIERDADGGIEALPEAEATRPANTPDAATSAAEGCTREWLLERAEAYLSAMASSNPLQLQLHASVRYTENGQERALGLGLWLESPRVEVARHFVDEDACSTATQAVLRGLSGRVVFGSRLRYVNDQLLEVETQTVRSGDSERYFAPDQIIAAGEGVWTEPLPRADRRSAQALRAVAMRYLDSSSDASLLPPYERSCERRLNGAVLERGSCDAPPGDRRLEQARLTVVDETTGVVTAIVASENFLGMYLIKQRAGALQNIEIIGATQRSNTGW